MSIPNYAKPLVRHAWADTPLNAPTDVVDPGDIYVSNGWQQGVKPPRPYFNWLLNYTAAGIRYLCQNGVAAWDSLEVYPNGAIVLLSGVLYQSLQPNNLNQNPATATTFWGAINTVTPAAADNSTRAATTAWVRGFALPLGTAVSSLSGQVTNAQVPQSAVTQWQAALAIAFSQLTGQIANGQVPVGAVTQWQASLSIAWGQLTGTKNADQLLGLVPGPVGSFAASTLARYDTSGYLYAAYLNQASGNNENPSPSQIMMTNGTDNFLRKAALTYVFEQMMLSGAVTLQADPGGTPANGTPGTLVAYY